MRRMLFTVAIVVNVTVFGMSQGLDEVRFTPVRTLTGLNWSVETFTSGVDHFVVLESGDVIVWDKPHGAVRRVTTNGVVNDVFALKTGFDTQSSYLMQGDGRWLAITQYVGTAVLADVQQGTFIEIRFPRHGLSANPLDFALTFAEPLLLYESVSDGQHHSFELVASNDGLEYVYRDPAETRMYIEESSVGRNGLWFDDDGYLLYGERLVTGDPEVFDSFFSREWWYEDWRGEMRSGRPALIGVSNAGHYYWQRGRLIMVYDATGSLVGVLGYDSVPEGGALQIDPHGNIYTLSYGGVVSGELSLLWIERDW